MILWAFVTTTLPVGLAMLLIIGFIKGFRLKLLLDDEPVGS
jgi:hypothetical protein